MKILLVGMPGLYIDTFTETAKEYNVHVDAVEEVFDAVGKFVKTNYAIVIINTMADHNQWRDFKRFVSENNKSVITCAYYGGGKEKELQLLADSFDILLRSNAGGEIHGQQITVFWARVHEIQGISRYKSERHIKVTANIVLNYDESVAHVGKRAVSLTDSESRIVKILCQNRGKVMSRDELFETMYPGRYSSSNRNIDVHIRNLREKLGSKSIRTIRGEGYFIE